jgi:1,4-dihydroxy-2-naphthoyl-CoA hydrolase
LPEPAWEDLISGLRSGLTGSLGIELLSASAEGAAGRIPNDGRTRQPMGLLHGGAYASLAETLASVAGLAAAGYPERIVVGQQVSLSLLRPSRADWVHGRAAPRHVGRTSQVWDVEMRDGEEGEGPVLALARVTLAAAAREP